MSDALPWMKLYPRETLADSNFAGWTLEERGAWLTLILHNWLEGSLPTSEVAIGRLLHASPEATRSIWSSLSSRFVPHPDLPGRLTSPRLEKEREAAMALAEKRGTAGKKGATSRWDRVKSKHGKRIANACASDGKRIADASGCHTDTDTGSGTDTGPDSGGAPAKQEPAGRLTTDEGLVRVATRLGAHFGRSRPLGLGKDLNRVEASFGRWLDTVGEDALVAECIRIAKEQNVEPSHLSWWPGWLDTVPETALQRAGVLQ